MRKFFTHLTGFRSPEAFNPWAQFDPDTDRVKAAPDIRRRMLRHYLQERESAPLLFVAEALGYQGGSFTGIPMTSERMLLNHTTIDPASICAHPFRQTSAHKPKGMAEPTATIIWKTLTLGQRALHPRQFVLWNAFPWHPIFPNKGRLSNRPLKTSEQLLGAECLTMLIHQFKFAEIIAVGNHGSQALTRLGVSHYKVRHPSNGGGSAFAQQTQDILHRFFP